jgi:hypothetical protein
MLTFWQLEMHKQGKEMNQLIANNTTLFSSNLTEIKVCSPHEITCILSDSLLNRNTLCHRRYMSDIQALLISPGHILNTFLEIAASLPDCLDRFEG